MNGLIIGGNGYVGNGIYKVLKKSGFNPISTTRSKKILTNSITLNLNDNTDHLNKYLSTNFNHDYFKYVIIASGYTKYIEDKDMGLISDLVVKNIIEANFLWVYRALSIINMNRVFTSDCKIIVISSTAGIYAKGSNIIYSAMKSAVNSLVRSSSQWMRKEQKVISLCPGLLKGGMTEDAPNLYKEHWKNIYKKGELPNDIDIGEKVKEILFSESIKTGSIIELNF